MQNRTKSKATAKYSAKTIQRLKWFGLFEMWNAMLNGWNYRDKCFNQTKCKINTTYKQTQRTWANPSAHARSKRVDQCTRLHCVNVFCQLNFIFIVIDYSMWLRQAILSPSASQPSFALRYNIAMLCCHSEVFSSSQIFASTDFVIFVHFFLLLLPFSREFFNCSFIWCVCFVNHNNNNNKRIKFVCSSQVFFVKVKTQTVKNGVSGRIQTVEDSHSTFNG